MKKTVLIISTIVLAVFLALIVAQNIAIAFAFPHLSRVTTDFSPAYLRRELRGLAQTQGQTVFFGDSVLWGYRLRPDQTAVAVLAARGCACHNFAFKKGGPANYYALARLFQTYGARPKTVVLEVNQKTFNPADGAYKTLHPALQTLATPLLSPDDRASLAIAPPADTSARRLDAWASSASLLYAMRSDIRETLYGDADTNPIKPITADALEGTYDLTPLAEANLSVRYLEKTADLFRASGTTVIAFMTPTNHTLLHDYIDAPGYRANNLFLRRLLERRGVRVLDFDAAFPQDAFLDEVHLKPEAQRRLASLLANALPRS